MIETVMPGETVILSEEGGLAEVKIISRSQSVPEMKLGPGSLEISFRIRFMRILRQYPFVPYNPGDEIEISKLIWDNYPEGYPGGWEFLRKATA